MSNNRFFDTSQPGLDEFPTIRAKGTTRVRRGAGEPLKGGVVFDVETPEQARIAEDAGAVAVIVLGGSAADVRTHVGVARMSDSDVIDGIIAAVSIPVMAQARIGHLVEAQILQALEVDFIDESDALSPADHANHIDKWSFDVPFVCGATSLGEALRRIAEGAAMIRTSGESDTGDVSDATDPLRAITSEISALAGKSKDELYVAAKELSAPYDLVIEIAEVGKLPVALFGAGGIATPADAALIMQLGADGVFVGSDVFASVNPLQLASAIVKATTFFNDSSALAAASRGLGDPAAGVTASVRPVPHRLAGPTR